MAVLSSKIRYLKKSFNCTDERNFPNSLSERLYNSPLTPYDPINPTGSHQGLEIFILSNGLTFKDYARAS
jgi:hypothetical protein